MRHLRNFNSLAYMFHKNFEKIFAHPNTFLIGVLLIAIELSMAATMLSAHLQRGYQKIADPEAGNFVRRAMRSCYENGRQPNCYAQAAHDFIQKFSLREVLAVFASSEKRSDFFSDCHLTAHYLGREAYKKMGSVRSVFSQSSYACLAGTLHGAVEGYFMSKGLLGLGDAAYAKEIPRVCGNQNEYQVPQQFVECNHGMGHATMFLGENDLIRALKLCDALHSDGERELCYTGALMANADGANDEDHPSLYAPKSNDPLYPCPLLGKSYQRQCYTYGVLTPFQSDLSQSITTCKLIPRGYREACFQTIGRDRTMISADPITLNEQCSQIPETDLRNECAKGVAYNLVIRFGPRSPLPEQFCNLADTANKNGCLLQVQTARGDASNR